MKRGMWRVGVLALGLWAMPAVTRVEASSHREAPFIAKLPKTDSTDLYMFRSYEAGRQDFVTLIADYQPFQEPFGGPNYYMMDPEALYEIHVDNVGDAKEHITFQFRFQNTLNNGGNGFALPVGGKNVAIPLINKGPITAGDESNLNVIETYTVKVVRGDRRGGQAQDLTNAADGSKVFKRPADNIGNKTFADYAAYAKSKIYDVKIPGCDGHGRMFAGQRAEPFAVNVGVIFDLINAPAAVVTGGNTASGRNAAPNPLANDNISTLALEVPIACLKGASDVIGAWQTASVRQARVINPNATFAKPTQEGGAWTQVSRLGMPLVNEAVIGLKDKDRFNTSAPSQDAQFADYVTNPTLPALIEVLFPTVMAPNLFPRADLVAVFLTGVPNVNMFPGTPATAEMQRLNVAIPPTAAAAQNNLGAAFCFVNGQLNLKNPGCDPAGFPNGRRPGDDIVDIELRAAMGYLLPAASAPAGQVGFTDGVLQDASQFDATFPYLKTPTGGAVPGKSLGGGSQ